MSFFFFKQKTAYELRISDWSSDVCSSGLLQPALVQRAGAVGDALAAFQHRADRRVRLEALHLVERGEVRVVVVEADDVADIGLVVQIGKESCRDRGCQYLSIYVVAGYFNINN